jgi:hypothetical protein
MKKIVVKGKKTVPPTPSNRVTTVESGMKTPSVIVQRTNIAKPYIYPGTDVPRYGAVIEINPSDDKHAKFLKRLEEIATSNGVETIGHMDEDTIFIKFQTKMELKTCVFDPECDEPPEIQLSEELPYGTKVEIEFDLNTYYNVKERKKGFNFCPKKIILHLDKKTQKLVEVSTNVRTRKNSGDRSEPKKFRGRLPKLEQRDE